MSKVRWDAKSGDQFIHNYKILQRVFEKRGIDKVRDRRLHSGLPVFRTARRCFPQHIDVAKLIRAKYQDNLEFMQWMKSFFDHNCATTEYDALDRRSKGRGECRLCFKPAGSKAYPRRILRNGGVVQKSCEILLM